MILKPYQECPICLCVQKPSSWTDINYNTIWWEKMCTNHYSNDCGFSQFFFSSYQDQELSYLTFSTKDFSVYVYGQNHPTEVLRNKTYFYHKIFPKDSNVQIPFQIWDNYLPDWNNLDKLNDKLKILRTFQ